jgi:hypothetical protein
VSIMVIQDFFCNGIRPLKDFHELFKCQFHSTRRNYFKPGGWNLLEIVSPFVLSFFRIVSYL